MKLTIFTYRVWDNTAGAVVIPERMATREFIEKISKGEIYEDSAKEADEALVERNGQEILDPAKGR